MRSGAGNVRAAVAPGVEQRQRIADPRSVVGLLVLAFVLALLVAARGGTAHAASAQASGPSGASGASGPPGPTRGWDIHANVDASKKPIIITGNADYVDSTGAVHGSTHIDLELLASDGTSLAANPDCGVTDPMIASWPATPGDAGTIADDGSFSYSIAVTCAGSGFKARVTASLPQNFNPVPLTSSATSTPFDYDPNRQPPPTTTPTTGTTAPGPTTTSKVVPFQPKLLPAPKPTTAPPPTLPRISGSRTQAVSPGDDTYNATLNYPEPGGENPVLPDASGLAKSKATDKTTRTLNTRLIAASAAGIALTGVLVSQILVLNRRGRALEASLPRIDDDISAG